MLIAMCVKLRGWRGQTHHGRFRREEFEGEVIGAIGQGVDFIRDPLHGDVGGFGGRKGGVRGDGESWRCDDVRVSPKK